MAHYNCVIHQLTTGFTKKPIPPTGEAEVSSVSACPRAPVAVFQRVTFEVLKNVRYVALPHGACTRVYTHAYTCGVAGDLTLVDMLLLELESLCLVLVISEDTEK